MTMVLRRRHIVGFLVFLVLVAGAVVFLAEHWSAVGGDGISGATLVAAGGPIAGVSAPRTTGGNRSAVPGAAVPSGTGAASRSSASPRSAATARSTTTGGTAGYFAAAHLRRAQAESRELAELQQMAGDARATATVRAEAQQQILQLEQLRQEETTAELVLEAKGYPQSLVMLSPSTATVVVAASSFTAADAALVGQAVAQVAGMDPAQVQIVPRSPS